MKPKKTKKKVIEAWIEVWAVLDDGRCVSDGSNQLAIYWNKQGATEWGEEMLGKGHKVVPVQITLP